MPRSDFPLKLTSRWLNHPTVCRVEEWKCNVILLFDEIHIQKDLVYNKNTGALVGFVELGEVNNQLQQFERLLDRKGATPSPSPLAHFPSVNIISLSQAVENWVEFQV